MTTALITGAASLMGEGIAAKLSSDGWDLLLTDINERGLDEVASRLSSSARIETAALDVTDRAAVGDVMNSQATAMNGIHALVNVAGGSRGLGVLPEEVHRIDLSDWVKVIDVNLKGVMNMVHGVLPIMRAQGSGSIVSIAAVCGLRGEAKAAPHSSAKAGVILFTQTMVLECAEYGVRINTVVAGDAEARWRSETDSESLPPLGRLASASDIGEAVAWLVSDRAAHVTGASLDVSGGGALH